MDISNIPEIIKNIDMNPLSQQLIDTAPHLISWLMGSIMIAIFLALTIHEVRKKFADRELKFGKIHFILGWLCFALAAFGIWSFFHNDYTYNMTTLYLICTFSIGFSIGSLYIFIEHTKTHGLYNSENIVFSSPWTGIKKESWHDLISIKASSHANWYILKFKSGTTIRLSYFLEGHDGVLELLDHMGYKPYP